MPLVMWFVFWGLPFLLGIVLIRMRRRPHRIPWLSCVGYLLFLTMLIGAALLFVASVAGARVLWREVAIAVVFTVTWRLLWELWQRTEGRCGQRWVRWARWRRHAGQSVPFRVKLIVPGRIALTALIFFPVMLSCVLTHRVKLADGQTPESVFQADYESVRFPTTDGLELDGWWIPKPRATRTIVIAHGAGANKGNFVWFLGGLSHEAYNLLMFDFRAHGASEGRVTTWGILERRDVLAAVDWLKRERPAHSEHVVVLGSSQGSMAAALAAAEDLRIDAVILDSPFVSARELAHDHAAAIPVLGPLAADWVLLLMSLQVEGDFFTHSSERAVASLGDRPVLVIHGEKDIGMPKEHAQRLHDAATGPRDLWFGPGGHSNIVTQAPEAYADRVFTFLDQHLPGKK